METPLFATAYCPPIAYIALLSRHETICIERHETFPKQTYRNRCEILTGNGTMILTVPATRPNGNHTLTGDMGITYIENWHIKHTRAITAAYNASPYYLYYKDDFEAILAKKYATLIELNTELLKFILKKMKIDTKIEYSTDFVIPANDPIDYRYTLSPKRPCPIEIKSYDQVFGERFEFVPNLSSLDLLFNLGPDSKRYLQTL